ncbi:MAG: ABC transporter substrate-binding protein [Bacteroidetes bacterium]|nr:ABC transporter substrate-binding protein [Bacteroidota bacterium]
MKTLTWRLRHLHAFGLVLCILLWLGGCSGQEGASKKSAADNGKGGPRIITAGPVVTSIVLHLGQGKALVATDLSSRNLEGIDTTLTDLGYYRVLQAEGILALKPTLVLVSSEAGPKSAIEQIQQAGVRVVVVPDPKTADKGPEAIRLVAQALALPADSLLKVYEEAVQASVKQPASSPSILFCYARGSADRLFVLGTDSPATQLAELSGMRNAVTFEGTKPMGTEGLFATQPHWVVLPKDKTLGLADVEQLKKHPQLGQLDAVKTGRILFLPTVALFGFGPETPAALGILRNAGNAPAK